MVVESRQMHLNSLCCWTERLPWQNSNPFTACVLTGRLCCPQFTRQPASLLASHRYKFCYRLSSSSRAHWCTPEQEARGSHLNAQALPRLHNIALPHKLEGLGGQAFVRGYAGELGEVMAPQEAPCRLPARACTIIGSDSSWSKPHDPNQEPGMEPGNHLEPGPSDSINHVASG